MAKISKNKKRYTFFDGLLIAVTIGTGLLLLLSSFAGKVDPRTNIWLAFLGLGYPFILLGNFILCFWWIIRKKWVIVFTQIIIAFLGFNTMQATFKLFGNEGSLAKAENHLRVLTYNVHFFRKYGDNNDLETKRQFIQLLKRQDADVLVFQEFYTRYKGEYNLLDSIENLLGLKHSYFISNKSNDYEARGLAIFSRYPLSNKSFIPFDKSGSNGSLSADININSKRVRIYNVHLKSISFKKEDYEYIEKVKEISPDKQSSKRIFRMLRSAFIKRAENVDLLKAELSKLEIPYIVAGDFNDTPASFAVNEITGNLENAFKKQGQGLGITYNGKFPNFQIDYIAASKEFRIVNYQVTKEKLSDHYPVRSDLELSN